MIDVLIIILAIITMVLTLTCYILVKQNRRLAKEIREMETQQRSLSTVYGRISEQWFPLMKDYPYNPQNFRFIGSPVDGIQFEDDKIIFCEFKVHKSQLNESEKRVRELVKNRKVDWEEFHFNI
ncbi:MAG: endonuclease [Candidatus Odinarchaeum yellowstonii]|uniref:Endonuclease n=1 Tax=Odinarchaeota yellowstonii (strain LCB_4) TaxID=1841599 RepID=A0AAF0D1U1_ODILC|nr:MAG: endonuclease [Candidatus Odinarchaeum yellowstonii]